MATWTAATAIPSGGVITSAWMSTIANTVNFLGAGGGVTVAKDLCFLRQNAAQSFSPGARGTANRVVWDVEEIDAASGHGTAAGTNMYYVAQAAGKYALQASIPFQSQGTASGEVFAIDFFKGTSVTSGTTIPGCRFQWLSQSASGFFTYVTPVAVVSVNAGEFLDVRANFSTSTGTSTAGSTISPMWSIQWVGA